MSEQKRRSSLPGMKLSLEWSWIQIKSLLESKAASCWTDVALSMCREKHGQRKRLACQSWSGKEMGMSAQSPSLIVAHPFKTEIGIPVTFLDSWKGEDVCVVRTGVWDKESRLRDWGYGAVGKEEAAKAEVLIRNWILGEFMSHTLYLPCCRVEELFPQW